MLKVVIIGYGEMFTNIIAGTLDANCEIVGVLRKETTQYSSFKSFIKDTINPSIDYNYIKSYNLPEIRGVRSVNSEEFRKKLIKLNPDIMFVASWGEKIEKATYDIPKLAAINVHPSLLPKYRGPNPYYWVIKNGEQESGVTFHLLDKGYDTGAILAQDMVKIYPSDTGGSLKKRTVLTARGTVCELLNALKEDIIIPLSQSEEKATYYSYPDELELDFSKSAEHNYAIIRAIHPWGKAYFCKKYLALAPDPAGTSVEKNTTTYVLPSTVAEVDFKTRTVSVVCGDGNLLKMSGLLFFNNTGKLAASNFIKKVFKLGETL